MAESLLRGLEKSERRTLFFLFQIQQKAFGKFHRSRDENIWPEAEVYLHKIRWQSLYKNQSILFSLSLGFKLLDSLAERPRPCSLKDLVQSSHGN